MCVCVYTGQWQKSNLRTGGLCLSAEKGRQASSPSPYLPSLPVWSHKPQAKAHRDAYAAAHGADQSWTNVCILFGHQIQKHSFIVNSSFESKREAHGNASLLAVSALFLFESNFKGYDKSHWSAFSACIVAVAMVAAISFRIIALNIMAKNRKLVSCNLVSVIWKAIQTRFVLWFIYPSIHPSIHLSIYPWGLFKLINKSINTLINEQIPRKNKYSSKTIFPEHIFLITIAS